MSPEALKNYPSAHELAESDPNNNERGEGINDDVSAEKYALFKGHKAKMAALALREEMQSAIHKVEGFGEVDQKDLNGAMKELSAMDEEARAIAGEAEREMSNAAITDEKAGETAAGEIDTGNLTREVQSGRIDSDTSGDGTGIGAEQAPDAPMDSSDLSGNDEVSGNADSVDDLSQATEWGSQDGSELRKMSEEITRKEELLQRHRKSLAEHQARREELQQEIDEDPNNNRAKEGIFFADMGIEGLEHAIPNVEAALHDMREQLRLKKEELGGSQQNHEGHPVFLEETSDGRGIADEYVRARATAGEKFGGSDSSLTNESGNTDNAVDRGERGDGNLDTNIPPEVNDDRGGAADHDGDVGSGRDGEPLIGQIQGGETEERIAADARSEANKVEGSNGTGDPAIVVEADGGVGESGESDADKYEARQQYEAKLLEEINRIYKPIYNFLKRENHSSHSYINRLAQSERFQSIDYLLTKEYAPLAIELGKFMGGDQLGQPETDTIDDATSRISQRLQQTYYQLDLITIGIKKYAESLGQRANNLRELEDLERLYFSIKNLNDKIQEAAVHYRKVSSAQA